MDKYIQICFVVFVMSTLIHRGRMSYQSSVMYGNKPILRTSEPEDSDYQIADSSESHVQVHEVDQLSLMHELKKRLKKGGQAEHPIRLHVDPNPPAWLSDLRECLEKFIIKNKLTHTEVDMDIAIRPMTGPVTRRTLDQFGVELYNDIRKLARFAHII